MHDESVPLTEVEAGRAAFERRIATLERLHQQVASCPIVRIGHDRPAVLRSKHTAGTERFKIVAPVLSGTRLKTCMDDCRAKMDFGRCCCGF